MGSHFGRSRWNRRLRPGRLQLRRQPLPRGVQSLKVSTPAAKFQFSRRQLQTRQSPRIVLSLAQQGLVEGHPSLVLL